jgi:hypothetical protein
MLKEIHNFMSLAAARVTVRIAPESSNIRNQAVLGLFTHAAEQTDKRKLVTLGCEAVHAAGFRSAIAKEHPKVFNIVHEALQEAFEGSKKPSATLYLESLKSLIIKNRHIIS